MAVGAGAACFISYARDDQAWAEWVAWQLEDAGYEVWLDTWSLRPGADFMAEIQAAVSRSEVMLVLVSPSYAHSRHARAELESFLSAGKQPIPVLLHDGPVPDGLGVLGERQFVRLAGLDDDRVARSVLLRAVDPERPPVGGRLRRLGATSPRLPGSRPRVWNVPERNDRFVGRVKLLKRLRAALTERSRAVLVGDPGMGKTQLAIEYAHRFAGEYELVWWIGPGQGSISAQLGELAVRLGAASRDTVPGEAARAVTAELRTRNRWLLVFDDVLDVGRLPEELRGDMGNGQILVVSRERDRTDVGEPIEVGRLTPEESSALLRTLVPTMSEQDAEVVAADMGDIPLAVGMAAGSLSRGISVSAYLEALSEDGSVENPPQVLQHAVRLGLDRLAAEDERAVALLSACALLAPQPFQLRDCVRVPDWTPKPLAVLLRTPQARESALRAVNRYGLGHGGDGALRIHPAAHSALRDLLSPGDRATAALGAQALLVAALPSLHTPSEAWAPLLPHLLAVAPQDLTRREGLSAVCVGCTRLVLDGEAATAVPRLTELREAARSRLGADDATTMEITSYLVDGLQATGEPRAALPLAETLLAWERRTFGDTAPTALETAAQLAALFSDAGDAAAAVELGMPTRKQLREVLGPDHPLALSLSATLLVPMGVLGTREEARTLGEDTLSRQRRVLGAYHPETLRTATYLAALYANLGDLERSLNLRDVVLHDLSLTLGPRDPAALRATAPLAALLIRMERHEEAQQRLHFTYTRQRETLGADHVDCLSTSGLLAGAYLAVHDVDTALTWARRAYDGNVRFWGRDGAETRQTAELLAVCLSESGRTDEAREVLKQHFPVAWPVAGADRIVAELLDGWSQATGDLPAPDGRTIRPPQPSESRSARPSVKRPGGECVLVSHVEADRIWADWVTFELEQLGYAVVTEVEDTHLGRPWPRVSDIVLVLLSPSYLASMTATAWTSEEWSALLHGGSDDGPRLVPLFVRPVETDRLPPPLRDRITPALYDLDPDAARDLLRFALEPERDARPPVFPGATGPDDDGQALLTRQLVNALARTAILQSRDSFHSLVTPLGVRVRDEVSSRTRLFETVRSLKARPGGLTQLVDALEAVEPESLAVTEARHIVGEIEQRRANR
ncbi:MULTISPECIES: FxSxx-COOH system tetratricopeptide repeat protein [unclassified Streptomyces]|uniref:FxSxx-COOH system tetratricopeptide repeat protein n=1 Tax=unclassified Streptomyces TaxID=2593676 RepID=UPI0023654559|nr:MULTISPECIES: FxSxx-COOH system tetratricopeptide repeat protein [unclassified Streptomyces]MDF3144273.1 FxSxx-COOH system tetratricopeptide repeat protein [Streptomyces sp. T21Q-yed]WDF37204.1 FxSxx-COOH system tetratricopeptide repeat protein [Streptomyces sp. T12]